MRFLACCLLSFSMLALPALAGAPVIATHPGAPAAQSARVASIPEPAALALFVLGAGVVGVAIRRRQR